MSSNAVAGGHPVKRIGIFVLAMVSVAAVLSVRSYPSIANHGWAIIFWYLIGVAMFLIPCALVFALVDRHLRQLSAE
jgi:hypothetical protein